MSEVIVLRRLANPSCDLKMGETMTKERLVADYVLVLVVSYKFLLPDLTKANAAPFFCVFLTADPTQS